MKIHIQNKIDEVASLLFKYELNNKEVGLYGGNSGIILFLYYYLKYKGGNSSSKVNSVSDRLNELIANISDLDEIDWVLDAGLSGVTLAITILNKNGFINYNTDELLSHTDKFFYKVMSFLMWNGNYDFLNGALGIGLYLLSRDYFKKKKEYLIDLIGIMYKVRERIDKNKIAWKTLIVNKKGTKLFGFDMGMAHGLAGVVMMLVKLYMNNINPIKVKIMLEPLLNFILSKKNINNEITIFPNKILKIRDIPNEYSRLAWCYGDLGISVAIWHASQALERKDWEKEAINILLHSAKRRDLKENSVVDAGLCHGTAGIAHIFNRMYGYTGIEELKEASGYWFGQTLKMARFEDGLAGYKAWQGQERGWVNEPGLLEGIAGIGLAMISAVSDIEPAWDECLLLS